MQREDESLSTRDLAGTQREVPVETAAEPAREDASPAEQDARFDRRPADADAQAGDSGQATADGPTEPEVSATQGDADRAVVAPRTSTRPARCCPKARSPTSSAAGRRFRPASSTTRAKPSRMPTPSWPGSCSASPRGSPRPATASKANGAAVRTSGPRSCESRCSAIARSSAACSRPEYRAADRRAK